MVASSTGGGVAGEPASGVDAPTAGPTVSAVIAHYGPVERTASLVADLQAQHGFEVQIIVSDDASPIPYPAQPGVTLVRSEVNGGYGAAVNRGAGLATGDWLLICNSDIRIDSGFLGGAFAAARSWGPAIFGFAQRGPGGPAPASGQPQTFWRTIGQHSEALWPIAHRTGLDRHWGLDDPTSAPSGPVGWVAGSLLLVPRAAFIDVGGFDERFYMYSEEVDLQRRLGERGVRPILLTEVEVFHEGGASSAGLDSPLELLRARLVLEEVARGPKARRRLVTGLAAIAWVDGVTRATRRLLRRDPEPFEHLRLRLERLREADRGPSPRRRSFGSGSSAT